MTAVDISAAQEPFARGKPVLKDINLRIAEGELVGMIGASGSGKSTLIRMIAGLEVMDGGAGGGTFGIFPRRDKIKALQALERIGLVEFAHQRASVILVVVIAVGIIAILSAQLRKRLV